MAFELATDDRLEVRDVTDQVQAALPDGAHGTCTVFCRHTTAGITVNEAEPRLLSDIETILEELIPDEGWAHDQLDDNADGHLRALLVGPAVTLPVVDGTLALGTWQSVLFVECDGPRHREVEVLAQ